MSHIWSEICVSGVSAVIQNHVQTSDVCNFFGFYVLMMVRSELVSMLDFCTVEK